MKPDDAQRKRRPPQRRAAAAALFLAAALAAVRGGAAEPDADLLRPAHAAVEDGLFNLAEQQLAGLLSKPNRRALSPDAARDAARLMARVLYREGKRDELLAFLDRKDDWVRTAVGESVEAFWIGLVDLDRGDAERSLKDLAKFDWKTTEPEYRARAERLRAHDCLKLDKTAEALASFERFDREFSGTEEAPENLLEWAKTLISLGRFDEALPPLSRLAAFSARLKPVPEGRYWAGYALSKQGRDKEAAGIFEALGGDTNVWGDLRAQAWLGLAALRIGPEERAQQLDALTQAYALATQADLHRSAGFDLGLSMLDCGRLDEGARLLKELISAAPADARAPPAQMRMAAALAEGGRFQQAAEEYQHYLETYKDTKGLASAYQGLGWALFKLGRNAESTAAFKSAYDLQSDPLQKAECLFRIGDAQLANSQFRLAIETYQRFLKEFPDSKLVPNAFFQLGESLLGGGDTTNATKAFADVVERFSSDSLAEDAMLRLAQIKETEQRWVDAVEAYTKLMAAYPKGRFYADVLYARGLIQHRLFHFSDALQDFDRIAKDFPDSHVAEDAFYMRAMCYYGLWQDKEALEVCHAFLEKYPDSRLSPQVQFWLSEYDYNQGSYADAEQGFLALVAKYPQHALADEALLRAGMAASKRKEYVHAVELLSRMVKEYPKSDKLAEARFAQAEALSELAQYSAAILIFDEIISKYPNSDLIWLAWGRKGDCQFTLGAEDPKRYEESLASYRVVAGGTGVSPDLVMQANCKIGRCMEKLNRPSDAFQQYYLNVILRYYEDREKGVWHNEASQVWFTRAAFNAADIMEASKDWPGVVSVLERVVQAGVPAAREAEDRIKTVKSEHWWLFY